MKKELYELDPSKLKEVSIDITIGRNAFVLMDCECDECQYEKAKIAYEIFKLIKHYDKRFN